MIKNMMKVSALALALMATSTFVAPSRANAYLLVMGASGETPANGPWAKGNDTTALQSASLVLLCIVTLPFCLLDEKSNGQSVSASDLAANGYSAEQIGLIQHDQSALTAKLQASSTKLLINADDTKASISSQIQSVYPAVSQTYLDFATGSVGLK